MIRPRIDSGGHADFELLLPKDFARPGLDKARLAQLINLVSDMGLGSPADRAKDILGRAYEYFLAQFASGEGKIGNSLSVALMAIGFFVAHLPRIRVEESVLEESLGEEYRQFELTRKRLIPGVW